MSETRSELGLANDHPALAIFDVFQAHRCDSVLDALRQHHIHQVFVPAACTGELQPLDVSVNAQFKREMKDNFSRWYADEVKKGLDRGVKFQDLKVDLRASIIKPLHANWLILAISKLQSNSDIITRGFEKTGILDSVKS